MRDNFAADFFGLPTYFVTNHKTEIIGHNVRIYHWEKRGCMLTPQFVAVLPATELVRISEDVRAAAQRALTGAVCVVGLERTRAH